MEENLSLIGKNIRKYRKDIGYTEEQVANKLGISTNDYIEYEINPKRMEIETLEKIAYFFNCKVDNFFMKINVTFCDSNCCISIGLI